MNKKFFIESFLELEKEIHKNAKEHGWWESDRNDGEMIALMHSELSECLEAFRHGNPQSEKIPAFSNAEEEFADCIIRIMDTSHARGFHLAEAIIAKHEYNKTRQYKHGGKNF